MNKISLLLLVIVIMLTAASSYGYVSLTGKLVSAQEAAHRERSLREINVKNSTLSGVSEFIFARISSQYTYFYEKNFKKGLNDKVEILYEWPFTYSFGVKTPENWNWCIKEVTGKPGYLRVNAPFPSLISRNEPNPKPIKVFKAVRKRDGKTVEEEVNSLAKKRIKEDAKAYLSDGEVNKTVTLAFAKHLQDIMNLSHKDSNPVAGVEINYVKKSVCELGE